MPIRSDGSYQRRSMATLQARVIEALKASFGQSFDTSNANPAKKLVDVGFTLPLDEAYQDLEAVYRAGHIRDATGENLDKLMEPYNIFRELDAAAKGHVHVTLKTGIESPPELNPWLVAGTVEFIDQAGRRFHLTDDVELPGRAYDGTADTGTASEIMQVNGTLKTIAFKVVLDKRTAVGHVEVLMHKVSGTPELRIRIETDVAGLPSGTLAASSLNLVGFKPTDGVATQGHFDECGIIDPGTYWVRIEITAGEATLDGADFVSTTRVKTLTSSTWSDSAEVADLNVSLWGDLIIPVESQALGFAYNIPPRTITNIIFLDANVTTRWNTNVAAFTNQNEFSGGRDEETDTELRNRFINEKEGLIAATPEGLRNAILKVAGVTDCTVIENITDNADDRDVLSKVTGLADTGETIGSGGITKIAIQIVPSRRSFLQYPSVKVAAASAGAKARVRLEGDTIGLPSASLASPEFDRQLVDLAVGTQALNFAKPNNVDLDTPYWLVIEATTGTFSLKGTAGGDASVKVFSAGVWSDSSLGLAWHEVRGGIPPHGYRAYVSGGLSDDLAQAQWKARSIGIRFDGRYSGIAIDVGRKEHTIYHDRPNFIPVVVRAKVSKDQDTSIFTQGEDGLKDIVVGYVGGIDTLLRNNRGLGLEEKLIVDQLSARLIDKVLISGTFDVPNLRVARKSIVAAPGSLPDVGGSGYEDNLTAQPEEEFIIENVATDVLIELVDEA